MPELEVLIRELLAVDGLASGAVAAGEVTRLAHEVRDDAVEDAVLVAEGLARPADPLLAGAQRAEVLARLRCDVDAELERDAADGRAADAHVEETTREGRHGVCVLDGCATEFVTKVPLRAWTTGTISSGISRAGASYSRGAPHRTLETGARRCERRAPPFTRRRRRRRSLAAPRGPRG